ncbi:hypothetical protein KFK09_010311 [Dendrobium nobile]|uniref:Uncharacterized protein n=1 Tax=Dendrobium nobile TaxID=94219 RepID=A0A8T3BPY4_DENNO|nr:hypothetical protein KFK09_010311 [Dendrobium nobile]
MPFPKSINRAPSPLEKGPLSLRKKERDRRSLLLPSLLDQHRSFVGPPPEFRRTIVAPPTPDVRRTTA